MRNDRANENCVNILTDDGDLKQNIICEDKTVKPGNSGMDKEKEGNNYGFISYL